MDKPPLVSESLTLQDHILRLDDYLHFKREIALLNSGYCNLFEKRLFERHLRDLLDRLGGMAGEW